MMCPECGAEYPEGMVECEGCDATLVEENAEVIEDVDFTQLVESTDVMYFGLVTGRLEEAGIPWLAQGETSRGVLPRDGSDTGVPGEEVVTVYVAENRFDEAFQLVRDFDPVGAGAGG